LIVAGVNTDAGYTVLVARIPDEYTVVAVAGVKTVDGRNVVVA